MQENFFDCARVAQHALVLGPCDHVASDPTVPAQTADPTIQPVPSQESLKSKSPCLARSKVSREVMRHKLRLLRKLQPDQSMKQSGPFLPHSFKGIVFTHAFRLGGCWEEICPDWSKLVPETVRCRNLIFGRDIGLGV